MSNPTAPTAAGDWESLARGASLYRNEGEEFALLRELLTFRLAGSTYAIPVERVREIVRIRQITRVPHVPSWVLGVIALRGEIVQVADMSMRLGLERCEATRRSRIIVLHGDDDRVTGVLVDAVDQVLRVGEDCIGPATGGEVGAVTELCERDREFISILDVDRVLELRGD